MQPAHIVRPGQLIEKIQVKGPRQDIAQAPPRVESQEPDTQSPVHTYVHQGTPATTPANAGSHLVSVERPGHQGFARLDLRNLLMRGCSQRDEPSAPPPLVGTSPIDREEPPGPPPMDVVVSQMAADTFADVPLMQGQQTCLREWGFTCNGCMICLPKHRFSNNQMRLVASRRRCTDCIGAELW